MTTETLVSFIKAHALAHYEDGGWDVVVECYSDDEIAQVLMANSAGTESQALRSFSSVVSLYADRQADARNSAF
jgi:hypothetical protein